jgi:choline dehydrogenase
MPHVFRLKDGLGIDHTLLRQGAEHEAASALYEKSKKDAKASGLLELKVSPRIGECLEAQPEWQAEKKRSGVDVFGPQGQRRNPTLKSTLW